MKPWHHHRFDHLEWPLPRRRRMRLRRQLFGWLVGTILMTACAVTIVFSLTHLGAHSQFSGEQAAAFVRDRFAESWDDAGRRRALASDLNRLLGASLSLHDAHSAQVENFGGECSKPDQSLEIRRGNEQLGRIDACFHAPFHSRIAGVVALLTAMAVFWFAAAVLAHKLTHPLATLIAVTRDIGAGNLKSRARLHRAHRNELGMLADAINDMAERIERQLNEQRELLAAVSHEVRSPLARLRLSAELLRENPGDRPALDAMDYEVTEIDALVGKLLASSRLDFGTLTRTSLSAGQVAQMALARRKLPESLLEDRSEHATFSGDATLVARALDNLLDNAEEHGGMLRRLVVRKPLPGEHDTPASSVVFEVWDGGKGFADGVLQRAFEPFFRAPRNEGERHASLGLGLSLVQRIARAHGGRAWAENVATGGARVLFSVG